MLPRLTTALLALAAVLVMAAPASAACPGADLVPAKGNIKKVRKATLCLINAERRSHGLRKLRGHAKLVRAARRHSRDMVRRGYFEHTSPQGSTMSARVSRAGYSRWASLGENIAWGSGSLSTPHSIVRSWMNSSGHRANILHSRFREIGVGIALGAPQRTSGRAATYTTDFGVRR